MTRPSPAAAVRLNLHRTDSPRPTRRRGNATRPIPHFLCVLRGGTEGGAALDRGTGPPLDVLHDEGDPALGGVGLSAGPRLHQGGLVGGGVQLGQVLLPGDGQRDVLEGLQDNRHLGRSNITA